MPSPNFAPIGWVARSLQNVRRIIDGNSSDPTGLRTNILQELFGQIPLMGEPALADEGALYIGGMAPGATALQLGLSAAYSGTVAALVIKNNAPAGSTKRLTLREIHWLCAVPGTSSTGMLYATAIDDKDRTPSTLIASPIGVAATVTAYPQPMVCTNMAEGNTDAPLLWLPISTAAGAPPTVPSPGTNARVIVGQGILRSVIPVGAASSGVADDYRIVFGATDRSGAAGSLKSAAGAASIVEPHVAVVLGPQQFFVLHLWLPSNATAGHAFAGLDVSAFVR